MLESGWEAGCAHRRVWGMSELTIGEAYCDLSMEPAFDSKLRDRDCHVVRSQCRRTAVSHEYERQGRVAFARISNASHACRIRLVFWEY